MGNCKCSDSDPCNCTSPCGYCSDCNCVNTTFNPEQEIGKQINLFKDLIDKAAEQDDRWNKIKCIRDQIKQVINVTPDSVSLPVMNAEILLLLVEQLMPKSSTKDQASKLQQDVTNFLGSLGGVK